jgi:hypothetical protein
MFLFVHKVFIKYLTGAVLKIVRLGGTAHVKLPYRPGGTALTSND